MLWLSTWKMVGFVLNGFVFVLIGLELPDDPRRAAAAGRRSRSSGWSALVVRRRDRDPVRLGLRREPPARLAARRIIARRDPRLARRLTFVVGWAGLRGAVSLAAALALPADFPERDLILLRDLRRSSWSRSSARA